MEQKWGKQVGGGGAVRGGMGLVHIDKTPLKRRKWLRIGRYGVGEGRKRPPKG